MQINLFFVSTKQNKTNNKRQNIHAHPVENDYLETIGFQFVKRIMLDLHKL